MKLLKTPLTRLVALNLMYFALIMNSSITQATVVTVEQVQCTYDPSTGQPNPFGSRAFITVTQSGADTTFRFETFPALVQIPDQQGVHKPRAVTLEKARTMIFYNTQIEVARDVMRKRSEYYFELIGFKDDAGFASYDEAMSCE